MTRTKSIYLALLAVLLSPMSANAGFILEQISPDPTDYVFDVDFTSMTGSGSGGVTAIAQAVDWDLGLLNSSTSGCEFGDYSGFTSGNIALIQRGACSFRLKVENAILAGAVGAIIFNQGNSAFRLGLVSGTLSMPPLTIPTLFATYAVGTSLDGAKVRMKVAEPGSLALLGLGLLGMAATRRRRKA